WRESCPFAGCCSECGLAFHWGDLLNMKLNFPPWCIESRSHRGLKHGVLAAIKTLLMSLRPWRFWRELKMTHQPRWGRLIAYPLITILLLYVFCSLSVGFGAYEQSQRALANRWATNLSPLVLAIQSTVLPFSSQPLWTNAGGGAGWTPRRIVSRYDWQQMGKTIVRAIKRDKFFYPGRREIAQVRVFQALLMILLCPVGFLALPISRRVCKVRWRHVARIWIYSFPLIALPIGADFARQILSWYFRHYINGDLLLGLTGLLLIIWWGYASRRYLKMQWPWLVAVAVVAFPLAVVMMLIEMFIIAVNGMGA
ncbi:MAG: hypothetical protein IH891_10110, partial [Planctomycetes bacterium]|nr:hypothetical protein [Planctomycetota bacterium]